MNSLPRSALAYAVWLLLACACTGLCAPARAQALHSAWNGSWRLAQSNGQNPGAELKIGGAASTMLTTGAQTCRLAYDGAVSPQELQTRLAELKQWQLDPANWPAGTDTTQLFGLRTEFESAQRLLQSLPPDTYRRVRLAGAGCESADERLMLLVLRPPKRLVFMRFPAGSLGVAAAEYRPAR